jgi:hypothetical protein
VVKAETRKGHHLHAKTAFKQAIIAGSAGAKQV